MPLMLGLQCHEGEIVAVQSTAGWTGKSTRSLCTPADGRPHHGPTCRCKVTKGPLPSHGNRTICKPTVSLPLPQRPNSSRLPLHQRHRRSLPHSQGYCRHRTLAAHAWRVGASQKCRAAALTQAADGEEETAVERHSHVLASPPLFRRHETSQVGAGRAGSRTSTRGNGALESRRCSRNRGRCSGPSTPVTVGSTGFLD